MNDQEIVQLTTEKPIDAERVLEMIADLVITDEETLQNALRWTAMIKEDAKALVSKKDGWLKPIKESVKQIDAAFKVPLGGLADAEKGMKAKIAGYITDIIERKNSLLDQATVLDGENRAGALAMAQQCEVPELPGLSVREVWAGEIEEPTLIVQHLIKQDRINLLVPNEKLLKELVKSESKDLEIPGLKCYKKPIVTIRTGDVQ